MIPAIAAIYVFIAAAGKSLTWFWPAQPGAIANEAALAFLAFVAAAAGFRFGRKARAAAAVAAAAIYTLLSAVGLAFLGPESPGIGRYRHYVFAPDACEFTARFPGVPKVDEEAVAIGGGIAVIVTARWSDFGALAAWQAECIPVTAGVDAGKLEAATRAWAKDSGLRDVEISVAATGPVAVANLSGRLGGSIIDRGPEPASTRVESRVHGGKRSLMRLTVSQPGSGPLSPEASVFLNSASVVVPKFARPRISDSRQTSEPERH